MDSHQSTSIWEPDCVSLRASLAQHSIQHVQWNSSSHVVVHHAIANTCLQRLASPTPVSLRPALPSPSLQLLHLIYYPVPPPLPPPHLQRLGVSLPVCPVDATFAQPRTQLVHHLAAVQGHSQLDAP